MSRSEALAAVRGRRASTTAFAFLSASCLLIHTAGPAGAAVEVIKDSRDDVMVQGHSTATGGDGCSTTETFVEAYEEFVYYQQFCLETGTGIYGSASPTSFEVAEDGASVHVVAEIELFPTSEVGEPAGVLHLDNTWMASGKAVRVNGRFAEHLPGGFRVTYRVKGLRTPASVSGTVPLEEGFIDESTSTFVTRTHV